MVLPVITPTFLLKAAGTIPDEVFGFIFQLPKSFHPHYGPGIDSSCNRNEYQKSSWE
jgi:hypothetical protein